MPAKKKSKRKKVAAKARRSTVRKKVSRKKVTARKKVTKKKVAKKTAAKKKVAKKRAKSKTAKKKVSKKKPSAKASTKKKSSKKKVARKKPSRKKASKKRISKKTVTSKTKSRSASKKNKKTATKKAATRMVAKKTTKKVRHVARNFASPMAASTSDTLIHGISPYRPGSAEDYMSDGQLDHFRDILGAWKLNLMSEVDRTVHHMQDEASNFPDPNDRATQESEFGLELRTRDRERKLLKKIASAMSRIDDGSYGYCEETGEEIGLQRLEARPVATLCLEAQERRELAERQFSDGDDQYR